MIYERIKRILLGEPLCGGCESGFLSKWKALSALSSDALSSVAYATDALLFVLAGFSAVAIGWSVPIALGIVFLLIILTASYRQTIERHPGGAGAYSVAKANLGPRAGLLAGAALMFDYILTVSVSVAAGVENVASAIPALMPFRAFIGIGIIALLMFMNLRGVRESGAAFIFPTYFFIGSILLMLGVGFWNVLHGTVVPMVPVAGHGLAAIPVILILRSFASGCAALTGIETIANNTAVFQPPATRNAKTTLLLMSVILGTLFVGVTVLAYSYGLVPGSGQTLISMLGRSVFGDNTFLYFMTQAATALILFVAANTSFMGFPRLASALARDRYLPRQFMGLGDRLVFSNGIIGLSLIATLILVIFDGETHRLIPLYAVGVFLSFTLSQAGMVAFHLRDKKPGWVRSLVLNAIGAMTTLLVLVDVFAAKFHDGAWIVALATGVLVFVFVHIQRHYVAVGRELSILAEKPPLVLTPVKHTVIVPISSVHRGVIDALRYALTISHDVRACYVELDPAASERMREQWQLWAPNVPLVILKSPYRSVVRPILKYIDDVEQVSNDDMVTVVVPEFVTTRWWHRVLHNQTALFIRAALGMRRGKIVTTVRYHLHDV